MCGRVLFLLCFRRRCLYLNIGGRLIRNEDDCRVLVEFDDVFDKAISDVSIYYYFEGMRLSFRIEDRV